MSARLVDRVLRLCAVLLTASMLVSALHDVSQAWDVGYYHWPFAARIGGVLPPDTYVFRALDEARFSGFPLLAEALQGILWRITGRAEATNLVAFVSVPLLAWLLRRRFDVPMHVALLAFFAIPLVQLHATSAYVDLPANVAVTALVVVTIRAWADSGVVSPATWAIALASAAIAANIKALSHPLVALALVALFVRAVLALRSSDESGAEAARARRVLLLLPLLAPLVFATPLKNAVLHHNPYYPIQTSFLGHAFPGLEAPYDSSPVWLEHAPRPVRFACSLLEVGVRPMTSRRRWTVDQWMPPSSDGSRMGGFFSAYVLFHLGWLAWSVTRDKSREARAAAIGFGAVTAIIAFMPQSHELRYYMDWMLVLVCLNLWLTRRADDATRITWLGALSTVALGVVLAVTRCGYVFPSGETFRELVSEQVDTGVVDRIGDGERVCVDRPPWTLLWAAPFHPGRRYVVKEAEEAGDCAGYRPIP